MLKLCRILTTHGLTKPSIDCSSRWYSNFWMISTKNETTNGSQQGVPLRSLSNRSRLKMSPRRFQPGVCYRPSNIFHTQLPKKHQTFPVSTAAAVGYRCRSMALGSENGYLLPNKCTNHAGFPTFGRLGPVASTLAMTMTVATATEAALGAVRKLCLSNDLIEVMVDRPKWGWSFYWEFYELKMGEN